MADWDSSFHLVHSPPQNGYWTGVDQQGRFLSYASPTPKHGSYLSGRLSFPVGREVSADRVSSLESGLDLLFLEVGMRLDTKTW